MKLALITYVLLKTQLLEGFDDKRILYDDLFFLVHKEGVFVVDSISFLIEALSWEVTLFGQMFLAERWRQFNK